MRPLTSDVLRRTLAELASAEFRLDLPVIQERPVAEQPDRSCARTGFTALEAAQDDP